MVDNRLWSSLMYLLNTKPRNAKSMPKLATAHTARDASSSMALRTSLVSKSHKPHKPLSLRRSRLQSPARQACSRLNHLPETWRLTGKRLHQPMGMTCFLRQTFSTSSTLHQTNRWWSLWARKARNQRALRYKPRQKEESLTARCSSIASTLVCRSIKRSSPCTTKSLLRRLRSRAKSTSVSTCLLTSSTWTSTRPHKND